MSKPIAEIVSPIQMFFCEDCGKLMGTCDHTVYRTRKLTKAEMQELSAKQQIKEDK